MKIRIILCVVALVAWSSIGKANVMSLCGWADGDGVVSCSSSAVSGLGTPDASLQLKGTQNSSTPGYIKGSIRTDSAADPTLTYGYSMTNYTFGAWTGYVVNYNFDSPTLITSGSLSIPNPPAFLDSDNLQTWTGAITTQINPAIYSSVTINGSPYYEYQGQIVYTGGAPVQQNDALDFAYSFKFSGGSNPYFFTQEVYPIIGTVPEPATLGLLCVAAPALAIAAWRRRRAR